MKADGCKEKMI